MNSGTKLKQRLAEKPYIIAIVVTILLALWLLSGVMNLKVNPDVVAEKIAPIARVQVQTFVAQPVAKTISLYGRTEPDRIVTLQAQVKGAITKVFAKRGSFVNKGDVIATIALNELPAQLEHFQTLLKQRRIDYYGAKKLFTGGYQGESALAEKLADVTDTKAELAIIENDILNTTIIAPFSGILNQRFVEVGDYVALGEDIAMIADLDPLVIRVHITENHIGLLNEQQNANIHILGKPEINGQVRYVASVADQQTNTFKAEIAIANENYQNLAGISSEVELPLQQISAIKVSPALLALDENGNIGVKSVVDDHVVFTKINLVKSDESGVWLSGLGEQVQIITLGQGFVRPGDKVQSVFKEP
ncbi:efflux RND transporter periplasmic adaptor subunit [Colwelliaceae bacterium BS250]